VLEIGSEPDTEYQTKRFMLQSGEVLVAYTSDIVANQDVPRKRSSRTIPRNSLDQNTLLKVVMDMVHERCSDIAGFLARTLPTFDRDKSGGLDRSLILIKNQSS
jgi:hypothetical protein